MAQDDVKSIDQLNEEADIAADYLEVLLDIADYEGDIEMGVMTAPPCKSLLMTILTSNILLAVMVKSLMLCSN